MQYQLVKITDERIGLFTQAIVDENDIVLKGSCVSIPKVQGGVRKEVRSPVVVLPEETFNGEIRL